MNKQYSLHDTSGSFAERHIGNKASDNQALLSYLGYDSMDSFIKDVIPNDIYHPAHRGIGQAHSEQEALNTISAYASDNVVAKQYIGMGYYDTVLPSVILRNVLENPGWYTAYTPYQPEISQGRLESLLNFQQMISDLTGLPLANASLLDEATSAAEAMALSKRVSKNKKCNTYFIADHTHPHTIDVVKERAHYMDIDVVVAPLETVLEHDTFGVLIQNPDTFGHVADHSVLIQELKSRQSVVTIACDLMASLLVKSPGEMGADIAVGTSQRFGVPLMFGGPHAGFFATLDAYKRSVPGRIIGVSKDAQGRRALRMSMQTREQHIRREKANSNICTAQALLANISVFYAIYHGRDGLIKIAERIHYFTRLLAYLLGKSYTLSHSSYFDTINVSVTEEQKKAILYMAGQQAINFRVDLDGVIGISVGESATISDIYQIAALFSISETPVDIIESEFGNSPLSGFKRDQAFLTHPVFNTYQSETDMMRYLHQLETKDLSLNYGMIPLGSCTMKLNAASEMIPVTLPEFCSIHPFAPQSQTQGYQKLLRDLSKWLVALTGYDGISLQPNSGAQGEYAGLLAISKYHESRGDTHRNICLIPSSAHGTNPASAQMAGMKVVVVKCNERGDIDIEDLALKIEKHEGHVSSIMLTYPSTHGVFEADVRKVCDMVHEAGGQVYLDGANMNAQIMLTSPGYIGADVSHLNLHKTFAIPHGGGGPGVGPIGVKSHLIPFLPGHVMTSPKNAAVSAAPYGSGGILPITWMYLYMLGDSGLRASTEAAILNANYIRKRLSEHYDILFTGQNDTVAHECIVDVRPLKAASGINEVDIAKRLMDYGFHAPTMSFPVSGTLMIEPTESESKAEIDRFIEAMISIREEIKKVEDGTWSLEDNPLVHAPHTSLDLVDENWTRAYSRETAVFPSEFVKNHKFWPTVNRLDDAYGDKNFCPCISLEDYQ